MILTSSSNISENILRPWEGIKENAENINTENINTEAEDWRSAKKTMRELIQVITKEHSTISKGRRKSLASNINKCRELQAAKEDMQRLCKVYKQSITGEWHQEANKLISDWSYLLKVKL